MNEQESKRIDEHLHHPPAQGSGLLDADAIVLTALFWPLGVLLTWHSSRWRTRDKATATALPIVGLLLLFAMILELFSPPWLPGNPVWWQLLRNELIWYGLAGAPLTAAILLALRLRPHTRWATVLARVGAVALLLVLLMAFLMAPIIVPCCFNAYPGLKLKKSIDRKGIICYTRAVLENSVRGAGHEAASFHLLA